MLQTLDAPLTTISELKKSPRKIIDEAAELETGVYVLNQSKPEAVIMPVEEYEHMVKENRHLNEQLVNYAVQQRISDQNPTLLSDRETRGNAADKPPVVDPNDGWN